MNDLKAMRRSVLTNLQIHILDFLDRTGSRPQAILAEHDAFAILEADEYLRSFDHAEQQWRGIPLFRIARPGLGIHLSAGAIPFREFPEPAPTLVLPKED